ncbi:MAG: family four-helix-bundle protein [Flavipsychrobacter sp.]|nr:family four-helix-bundle protein [Flavipsychrobacter sp.]
MEQHEAITDILNDLLKINNDRIEGYEKAISESKGLDIDLKAIFEGMIRESSQYKDELTQKIHLHGGEVEDDTTSAGKIYRAWMDIKAAMTDSDRHSILASCEFGEDAAQRAYEAALSADSLLDADCRKLIKEQQAALKKSHDVIKKQRDVHKSLQS